MRGARVGGALRDRRRGRGRTGRGVPLTGGGTATVEGTALDAPTQALGGGFNSTLSAGTVMMASPLAPGESIVVQFLLGVQQPGAYAFFVNVEAVTDGPPAPARTSARPKSGKRRE